ncbi:MarR family transcriptional regulator [Paenibacillus sp. NEAU-GSW1]|uniref:MarR family transcriptional regulator n=1 Tax=Paenibacillus sp. NEAU-GSW1 TaxID=2682486 RepID=UPI0012E1DE6F|nr:MarR family transcriptional regulator [Paenibacillus sp. NEAU-GSW1]
MAEATATHRSAVSRLVKQLEMKEYVKKETSPNDHRGVLLSLTELGQRKIIDALNEKEIVFYERISQWIAATK